MQSFPPPDLVSYVGLILVTDELQAPADFLIHRFLHLRLKDSKQSQCLFISVSEDMERIKAVASKSNLNLSQNGRFKFIDLNAHLEEQPDNSLQDSRLRRVFDVVTSELYNAQGGEGNFLVILDDIASLEWLGFSVLDLSRLCRALKAFCLKERATLVIRHHIISPSEPGILFQHLLQLCSYHVEVRPLSSGRSGAVSGELCLHTGPVESEPSQQLIARPTALQYRLTDGGAIFFNKGTSEGVL
ncbi:hypothetical protein PAXRUDRAFT_532588 [Paxillus rubicundulus Ve08.2h10]|uniref:Elongator complex protein 6 n=1 Tax=Paxillus rubicundulus Ve08.2h10 TaxID=930991 RepID=A0A0D0ECH6_9AGAM|nr:hypothetical protein PAXRUDRAFT_532588 [Paxillus rubicundulus Ve08.2h10]